MIKAVIFDLDGTLLNSIEDLANSVNAMMLHFGREPYSIETIQSYVGNGVYKLVERAFGANDPLIKEAFAFFYDDYAKHTCVKSFLYEGIESLLLELNQRNIPMAILTNKAQDLTDKIVKHYLKEIDFVAVIGDRFDNLKKPNPHYPLNLAHKMQLNPHEILFVGDSEVDIQTAQNAGFVPLGVSWGFRDKNMLLKQGADHIVDDAKSILDYFV